MLNYAMSINPIAFSQWDWLKGVNEMKTTSALLYLIAYDYEHEDYPEKEQTLQKIKSKLDVILHHRAEPTFENVHNWGYPLLCQSIALLKNKPDLWNLFNEEEKAELTFFMRMFLYTWNFGCNTENNYHGTWGIHGNFAKGGTPNYMLTNEALLPFLASFFECTDTLDPLNQIINDFHWGKEKNYMLSQNFHNSLKAWTATGVTTDTGHKYGGAYTLLTKPCWLVTEDFEYGMTNYNVRGNGKGIKVPLSYTYKGKEIELREGLIDLILQKCFSLPCQTKVVIEESSLECSTENNEVSPFEGQQGMMLEFNSKDFSTRSSLFHCSIDFVLVASTITSLKLLNLIDVTNKEYWNNVKVGMEDYLFKKEHNYRGYSMGQIEKEDPVDITLWKEYWVTHYR